MILVVGLSTLNVTAFMVNLEICAPEKIGVEHMKILRGNSPLENVLVTTIENFESVTCLQEKVSLLVCEVSKLRNKIALTMSEIKADVDQCVRAPVDVLPSLNYIREFQTAMPGSQILGLRAEDT